MSEGIDSLKATLKAMARQGASEIAQALPAFPDSMKMVETPGMPGSPVSQEVYREHHPTQEPEMEHD